MTDDFLSDLYFYCTESLTPPDGPEERKLRRELGEMEQELTRAMGFSFLSRYQQAMLRSTAWEGEAAFLSGLRLGVRVMLAALPYSAQSAPSP